VLASNDPGAAPRPDMVRVMDHRGDMVWVRRRKQELNWPLPRPFIGWAGGKARNSKHIMAAIPPAFGDYYEPFLGGGAIFFALYRAGLLGGCHCKTRRQRRQCSCRKVHLNDANADLMTAWEAVRDDAEGVVQWLSERTGYRDEYFEIRSWDHDGGLAPRSVTERGARMIYISKLAFSGQYAVDRAGCCSSGYAGMDAHGGGYYFDRNLCDAPAIRAASTSLVGATLTYGDFSRVYTASEGDLVFLDPPYCEPVGNVSKQADYRKGGFTSRDHARVADTFRRLANRGCHVIACNHDTPQVRELYDGFRIESYGVNRLLTKSAAKRRKVSEVIITTCPR